MRPTLLVICGPTAIGKTALAVRLAQHYSTEVLSSDSRQFYQEMAIGTAKPTIDEMQGIPHHFVDFLSIHQDYNAGAFERDALKLLDKLFQQHKVVVMAGGSGLYVQAVCEGFDDVPAKDENIRAELMKKLEQEGIEALQAQLKASDPSYFEVVDIHNPHRIIRGLEVNLVTGKSFLEFRKKAALKRPFNVIKVGLEMERETLYERINKRVELMMEAGQLEEARGLYEHRHLNALQTVGYRELFEHFDGDRTLENAVAMIQQNTRRFAKRQLTWLRKDEELQWYRPADFDRIVDFVNSRLHDQAI